jgi:hypothetical protein
MTRTQVNHQLNRARIGGIVDQLYECVENELCHVEFVQDMTAKRQQRFFSIARKHMRAMRKELQEVLS